VRRKHLGCDKLMIYPFPNAGTPEIMTIRVSFPAKACTSNCTIKIASFKNEIAIAIPKLRDFISNTSKS
jgi:hypothetical protein